MKTKFITSAALCFSLAGLLYSQEAVSAIDAAAAEALAKKEGCLKCHGIDKAKEAKSFKDIATKFKSKADADAKLLEHLATGPKVKLEDGTEQDHKIPRTKDKAELANLVAWLRSQAK